MTTGAKVAIGCAVAVVLAGVAAIVTVGAGAWWLKGKVEETTGDLARRSEEMESYQEKANANPFTPPADRVIPEARLLKFIEVRKGVYDVYEAHRAEFEGMKDRKDASLSDVMKAGGLLLDARTAVLKGLAEAGMNEEEYQFIVQQVYRSAWASAAQKETGKTPEEVVREAGEAVEEAPGGEEGAEALRVPQANIELFRKHEADLKKYAMEGLALAGL
ncbi:MAG TPA: hypothetical protein VLI67_02885 [Vicinamibacteria bacterium]|nr:hypothetical protein [Vicinamibacteria bacterium]